MSKKSNSSLRRTRQVADEWRKRRDTDYFDYTVYDPYAGEYESNWDGWDEYDDEDRPGR